MNVLHQETLKVILARVVSSGAIGRGYLVARAHFERVTFNSGSGCYPNAACAAGTSVQKAIDRHTHSVRRSGKRMRSWASPRNESQTTHKKGALTLNTVIGHDYKLAARRGDLEPYFQPIVDLKSGRLKALEARVRLHVGAETLSAGDVLAHAGSAAERFELDFLILETALSAFSSVSNNLLDGIQLAINLSPQTLLEANFMARLERTIDDSSYEANRLHLEVPIETFELDTALAHARAHSLVETGLTLAVDHVSNAHSVETLLNNCRVSVIKLDEAFVSRLPTDPHACEMLSTIVETCKQRNVLVGAEGINRMDRLHCLQGVGCDEGQGMLVCRPSRIGDLRKLLERGRCW